MRDDHENEDEELPPDLVPLTPEALMAQKHLELFTIDHTWNGRSSVVTAFQIHEAHTEEVIEVGLHYSKSTSKAYLPLKPPAGLVKLPVRFSPTGNNFQMGCREVLRPFNIEVPKGRVLKVPVQLKNIPALGGWCLVLDLHNRDTEPAADPNSGKKKDEATKGNAKSKGDAATKSKDAPPAKNPPAAAGETKPEGA